MRGRKNVWVGEKKSRDSSVCMCVYVCVCVCVCVCFCGEMWVRVCVLGCQGCIKVCFLRGRDWVHWKNYYMSNFPSNSNFTITLPSPTPALCSVPHQHQHRRRGWRGRGGGAGGPHPSPGVSGEGGASSRCCHLVQGCHHAKERWAAVSSCLSSSYLNLSSFYVYFSSDLLLLFLLILLFLLFMFLSYLVFLFFFLLLLFSFSFSFYSYSWSFFSSSSSSSFSFIYSMYLHSNYTRWHFYFPLQFSLPCLPSPPSQRHILPLIPSQGRCQVWIKQQIHLQYLLYIHIIARTKIHLFHVKHIWWQTTDSLLRFNVVQCNDNSIIVFLLSVHE